MASKAVNVSGYSRRTKSGRVVQVKAYKQVRDLEGLFNLPGRPGVAGRPGEYPRGRMFLASVSPDPKKASRAKQKALRKRIAEQKTANAALERERAKRDRPAPDVPDAVKPDAPAGVSKTAPSAPDVQEASSARTSVMSEAELAARIAAVDARITQVIDDGGDTQTRFSAVLPDGSRVYTPERAAIHREILTDLLVEALENGVPQDRQVIMAGGLPGAGKTTLLANSGVDTSKFVTLNPDDFKQALADKTSVPGTEDGQFSDMEMAAVLHMESGYLMQVALEYLEDNGFNFVLDATLAGDPSRHVAQVARLKGKGYEVHGVFSDISIDMSEKSARDRYMSGAAEWLNTRKGPGGRYVPAHVSRAQAAPEGYRSQNRANYAKVESQLASSLVVDNEGYRGEVLDRRGSLPGTELEDPVFGKKQAAATVHVDTAIERLLEVLQARYGVAPGKVEELVAERLRRAAEKSQK